MPNLTSEQVSSIADSLKNIATAIGDYYMDKYDSLSLLQRTTLKNNQDKLLQQADSLYTESATLVLNDVRTSLTAINSVTDEIHRSYKDLQDIQKAIDIAASVLNLGSAILSKNPESVGKAIGELVKNVKNN